MPSHRRTTRSTVGTVIVGTMALVLAACAEEGTAAGGGSGEGIEFGASKAEYQEAFEDMAEIELITQTTAPKGDPAGRRFEAYHEAITEWSGGKITFDTSYSNAIASPEEAADALVDGRLDMVNVQTLYQPSEFPATNAVVNASFVGVHTPVLGELQAFAWMNEVGFQTDEIFQEFDDAEMHLLFPYFHGGSPTLMCSEPRTGLDSMEGAQTVATGETATAQLEALGMTPVSMAYPEIFESLQRGVVDCSESTFTVGALGGFIENAGNVAVDPEVGFVRSPGTMAMSKARWDELPLVAQQLLHDRLDVFAEASMRGVFDSNAEGVAAVAEANGAITPFDDDARDALTAANAEILDATRAEDGLGDGDAFVDSIEQGAQDWLGTLQELGYTDEVQYAGWADWYAENDVDLQQFVDQLSQDVLEPARPE